MTSSNSNDAVVMQHTGTERRTHSNLREIFPRAYEIAVPLLGQATTSYSSGSTHFLRIVLHDAFPNLHQQEIAILSVSIERVFRERGKIAP